MLLNMVIETQRAYFEYADPGTFAPGRPWTTLQSDDPEVKLLESLFNKRSPFVRRHPDEFQLRNVPVG